MADDLIQEVEDSLREERMAKFWQENGGYIIGGCILAVLLTAFISGWQGWNAKVNAHDTALIIEAIDSDDLVGNLEQVAPVVRAGPRTIALLTAAGKLFEEGRVEDARAQFDLIAMDQEIPDVFRDLAMLQSVRLDTQLLSKSDPSEINEAAQALLVKLSALWQDDRNPWKFHARYQAGLITGSYLNDYKAAHQHLEVVMSEQNLVDSLKQRAEILDHVYELDFGKMSGQHEKDAEG